MRGFSIDELPCHGIGASLVLWGGLCSRYIERINEDP